MTEEQLLGKFLSNFETNGVQNAKVKIELFENYNISIIETNLFCYRLKEQVTVMER